MSIFKEFSINLVILLFPLFFVFLQNFEEYNYQLYIPSIVLFFVLYSIFFSINSFFYLIKVFDFSKFKLINSISVLFFVVSFFIEYYFSIIGLTKKLVIALLILVILFFAFFRFKNLNIFIFKFLLFYLIFNIFYINFNNQNIFNLKVNSKNTNSSHFVSEKKLPNLYLIILDQMTSPKILDEIYNLNVEEYIDEDIFNIYSAKSNYNDTRSSLSNFFYERQIFDKNTAINKIYPFQDGINEPNFLLYLKNLDYKIFSMGNYYVKCMEVYNLTCVEYIKTYYPFDFIIGESFFTRLFEKYILREIQFVKNTIANILLKNYRNEDGTINIFENKNYNILPINHFHKILKMNSNMLNLNNINNAFIIHEWAPHHPYRKSNCELYENLPTELNTISIRFDRYKNSVKCVLKEVQKLLTSIQNFDNNSLIFVFADHGSEYRDTKIINDINNIKRNQLTRNPKTKDILILSKLSNECKKLKKNIKNINEITEIIRNCIKVYNF